MIRWISDGIGTAAFEDVDPATDIVRLDVRDLVDKGGNPASAIRAKLDEATAAREAGRRVVVCCDYGMSRSNAIAAGLLSLELGVTFDDALAEVMRETGETAIRVEVVDAVRRALADGSAGPSDRGVRSILVTGGSGFLGELVVPRLEARHEIVAPPHSELDVTSDAVVLDRLVRERQVDTIVHLANPRVYSTSAALGEMLAALKNVADVCVIHGVHLVFPSSWEIFSGYREGLLLADESLEPLPGSSYGHAKLLCEHLLRQLAARQPLQYSILRFGPVYGPTSSRPKFLWNFIGKALRGEPIVTHRYRNGRPALDLLHADDATTTLATAAERRPPETLHVGTGTATSTFAIAQMVVDLVGATSPVEEQEIDDDTASIAMDATRAEAVLDWKAERLLEAGLRELIDAR